MSGYFEDVHKICSEEGAPEGWRMVSSEMLGSYPNYTHYQIKGACYSETLRGPRKGKPNWRKPIAGTERTYIFEAGAFRARLAALTPKDTPSDE